MARLLIEYQVDDFDDWKQVFDADPMDRRSHGVTGHSILRSADDPQRFLLAMDFGSAEEARDFRDLPALQQVWQISGAGQSWVLEESETKAYGSDD